MISALKYSEIEQILKIWLDTSIKAHDFINKDFWCDKIDDMRNIYIPSTMTRVFSEDNTILGFYCLSDQLLNALFVSPNYQNIGIGSALLSDAKKHSNKLSLSVYKENKQAISFYKKHNFTIKNEEIDPHTKHLELVMEWIAD